MLLKRSLLSTGLLILLGVFIQLAPPVAATNEWICSSFNRIELTGTIIRHAERIGGSCLNEEIFHQPASLQNHSGLSQDKASDLFFTRQKSRIVFQNVSVSVAPFCFSNPCAPLVSYDQKGAGDCTGVGRVLLGRSEGQCPLSRIENEPEESTVERIASLLNGQLPGQEEPI